MVEFETFTLGDIIEVHGDYLSWWLTRRGIITNAEQGGYGEYWVMHTNLRSYTMPSSALRKLVPSHT